MKGSQTFDARALFAECRKLRKTGDEQQARALLIEALRRGRLGGADVLRAGRILQREAGDTVQQLRITICGQCTTTWLTSALAATATARLQGRPVLVTDEEYDNVIQALHSLDPTVDAVVLLPWSQRLLGNTGQDPATRVEEELGFWQSAWRLVQKQGKARLIQVGYDWFDHGARGHYLGAENGGEIDLVRRMNAELRNNLPQGTYFVDLEQISGHIGRNTFYDQRSYLWTKQPFSDEGTARLAHHLAAGLSAAYTGSKKVLVLDLDNTLWGGVVGDTGSLGIDLGRTPAGEAHQGFQRLAKDLAEQGCLLAVCSKNNPDDARAPFYDNPDMVLRLADFAAFEASWEPKYRAIRKIADKLNLGLDAFVFFDDEPAEREHVRQALPEVEVVEVPDDPADYRQALLAGLWFESTGVTAEDKLRTEQYRSEQKRRSARDDVDSLEIYLSSLDMIGEVSIIDDASLDRVTQLIGKTNQFNLTTRRHTREEIVATIDRSGTIGLTLRMRDKFGDYGLVSVVIAIPDTADPQTLGIDTWLMSCRVIGRTAEQFFFNALLRAAREKNCHTLLGEFLPTAKNVLVADMYEKLGFTPTAELPGGGRRFTLNLADATPVPSFVAHQQG